MKIWERKLILFMIATGLRRSEAFNVQWKDIDLENRTLLISSTRSKGKRTESIVLGQSAIEILDSCDKSTDWPFMNIRTVKVNNATAERYYFRIRVEN